MRVADYIIDFLYQKGARHIFTLAGGGAMFLNDAVACHKKIKCICNHHEQACAMAAEAYAKTNNTIGAVMVTSGPGSTNAITGLLEAYQNSIPVIIISSQAKKSQMTYFSTVPTLRQFGIQEVDIIPIVKPLTKYAAEIEKPEDTRWQMEKAYALATSGRPGPVWLDIPPDVAASAIDVQKLIGFNKNDIEKRPIAKLMEIKKVLALIKSAKKPLIIAGGGIRLSGSADEFKKLTELLKIPVVVTEMGIGLLTNDDPYYIGHGGTKGDRAANIVMQNCDLILCLGSRLAISFTGHEYDKFAPQAKKIVIDIDQEEHKKNTIKIDYFIKSDAKYFIEKLGNLARYTNYKNEGAWLKKCQLIKKEYGLFLPNSAKNGKINMYQAVNAISKYSKVGDHFTFDAGITAYICTQTIKLKDKQRAIIPGATLTMGYNLPAVIGIWAAIKNKTNIICITGDGSLQMNIHELATIVFHKIPAKIFVLNNEGYLAIRTTQRNFFQDRFIGESKDSGVLIPDTKKIAEAYGIKFVRIARNENLEKDVSQVLNCKDTVICEIMCPKWQDILTVSSKKLPDGKMVSQPIDNMFPFLSEKSLAAIRDKLK